MMMDDKHLSMLLAERYDMGYAKGQAEHDTLQARVRELEGALRGLIAWDERDGYMWDEEWVAARAALQPKPDNS